MNELTDVVVNVVLQFSDPFDMIRILQVNSTYARFLQDDGFWRSLIQRKFGIAYDGSNPKDVYIGLFYGPDMLIKNMNPKYHWIAYLIYFSGDVFNGSFRIIPQFGEFGFTEELDRDIEHLKLLGLSDNEADMIHDNMKHGERSLFFFNNVIGVPPIYIGIARKVEIGTYFSLRDPVDIPLGEMIPEGMEVSVQSLLEAIDPRWLQMLEFTEVESIWSDDEIPEKIEDFAATKIQEASEFGARETVNEMLTILTNMRHRHRYL